jgi:putative membrane protein
MVSTGFPFSAADRDLVGAAVSAAEQGTDGEIVTIVARRSDDYRDTALVGGVLAMLLVLALLAFEPRWIDAALSPWHPGWDEAPTMGTRLLAVLVAEIAAFALVFAGLRHPGLRLALTPGITKARRVRRRAIEHFKVGAESRTVARVGVLLFLSLDEHRAEIVADAAIHARVPPERWGDAMAAMLVEVRAGRPAHGMAAAVAQIGTIIGEHFPKTADDLNELPDRLIEL